LPVPGATYATNSDISYHEAELGFIDKELERLFRALDARTEPAYLLLTADHGSVFRPGAPHGPHYGYDLYTATLHVPLVIRGPNLAQRRIDDLASLMDVAPTILDLAGVEEHSEFEGRSLVPLMTGVGSDAERNLFHEFYLPERDFRGEDPLSMVSVRSPNWNLVLDRTKGHYELYDWKADYLERHDLYEEQAMSADIVHLRSLLGAFLQQVHRRPPGAALLASP
jgi:arylsulfatase A-like enzyme